MTMFNKLRKAAKKERVEMDAREMACKSEITRILREFNCEMRPRLVYGEQFVIPELQIVAHPKPDNEQPNHDPALPTGGATSGGEGEPITAPQGVEAPSPA